MSVKVPVVYLAFANALDDHLENLKLESRAILKALQGLEKDNKIRVHREESSQVDEIYEDLLTYDQDIVIFHYGGHADGSMLQLEGGKGSAGGLAHLLGRQKSLKLVFLNGCATKDQVQLLHEAGVPAVIATAVKINDEKATIFSTAFYQSLAKGRSIEESFAAGKDLLETKFSGEDIFDISFNRFPAWGDEAEGEEQEGDLEFAHEGLEWALYTRPEVVSDLSAWRLDAAQSEWRVALRDAMGVVRSAVDDAPIEVTHRSVTRRLPTIACDQCGSVLLSSSKVIAEADACQVCAANSLMTGEADTALPDQVMEPSITSTRATNVAREAFEVLLTAGKANSALQLSQPILMWIPYWNIAADVVVEYTGDVAMPSGIESGSPKLKWSTRKGEIHNRIDVLESASTSRLVSSQFEQRDLSGLRAWSAEDTSLNSLPGDIDLGDAFKTASMRLQHEIEQEVSDQLGGTSQRDIHSSVKYDQVNCQLIWLPKWLVVADYQEQRTVALVDGQNASIEFPSISVTQPVNKEVSSLMKQKLFGSQEESARATRWASLYGGIGLGIMVGLLLGLAAPGTKSIVGIFIGAVGVALAALLGLNDRHFSVAKGIRIGSFGLAVAISSLSGIYIRDHGLLTPGYDTVSVAHYEQPVDSAPSTVVIREVVEAKGASYLFSDGVDLDSCTELQNAYESEISAQDIVSNFKTVGDAGWLKLADEVAAGVSNEADQKSVLFAIRDAACGFNEFDQPAKIAIQDCDAIRDVSSYYNQQAINLAFGNNGLEIFLVRLNETVSPASHTTANVLLSQMLCASHDAS